jgi:peroxiredoxin
MKKIILLATLALLFVVSNLNAQKNNTKKTANSAQKENPLKGLKKAGPNDLDPSKPIMLDPFNTPIYFENLSRLKPEEFMNAMMSGDYVPEPYIDKKANIKVIVLRKAGEEEKKQMLEMRQGMMESHTSDEGEEMKGKAAAKFSVTDINGKAFSLDELKGKVLVLNFWFIECKPCVSEMPELNKLVEKYKGKEVVFIGFATNDKAKLQKFLSSNKFSYNIIPDSKEVADSYNVKGFPTHIVIDRESIIRYYTLGLGPTTMSDLEKMIQSLLK